MLVTEKGLTYFIETQCLLDKVPVKRETWSNWMRTHMWMCIHMGVPLYFLCEFLVNLSSWVEFILFYSKLIVCYLLKKKTRPLMFPPLLLNEITEIHKMSASFIYSTFTVMLGVGSVPWELMFWVWDTLLFLVIIIEHLPVCCLRTVWSTCFLGHHPEFSLFSAVPCSCYKPS